MERETPETIEERIIYRLVQVGLWWGFAYLGWLAWRTVARALHLAGR